MGIRSAVRARRPGLGVGLGALALSLAAIGTPPAGALAPGDLDPRFGSGGKVTTDLGSTDVGTGVAIQPDGKVVVGGYTGVSSNRDFALLRYNPDGSLDTGFGAGGKVVTDIGSPTGATDDLAEALAIQPDGKIVLAGRAGGDFALARYNPDGSLDTGFGTGGKVVTDIGSSWDDFVQAVAILPGGKIVVAGGSGPGGAVQFALAVYTPTGELDTSFGADGKVTTDLSTSDDWVEGLAVQPGPKIVAAGKAGDDFGLARYELTGVLDSSFGTGGKVTTDFGPGLDSARAVAVQPDGKIVAAGFTRSSGVPVESNLALARYKSDGSLDPTFGSGGKVVTDLGTGNDSAEALALQPDGKIVVAGHALASAGNFDFAVARYNPDGSLDATFGSGGKAITSFGASNDLAEAVAIQPNRRIVAAGQSGDDIALARYRGSAPTVTPGVVRRNTWYLNNGIDPVGEVVFSFGRATDVKVVGDWDGNGTWTPGVIRGNTWYLNNGTGPAADVVFTFGRATDTKIVGDWDG
jgi:uncharacterized delta-60 repeat protein